MTPDRSRIDPLQRSFWAAEAAPSRTGGCPEPELIWDAAHARLAADAACQVVEHIAVCGACAADWRLALRSEMEIPAQPTAPTVPHPSRAWGRKALLAAAAVLILAGALLTGREAFHEPTPATGFRSQEEMEIRALIPEDRPVPKDRTVLRWTPIPAATAYDIEISTIDLKVLVKTGDLTQPEFTVPPAALQQLGPDRTLVWRVEARIRGGRRVVSQAFLTRIE